MPRLHEIGHGELLERAEVEDRILKNTFREGRRKRSQ